MVLIALVLCGADFCRLLRPGDSSSPHRWALISSPLSMGQRVSNMVQFRDEVQNHSVTWVEVGRDSKRLDRQLLELGPWKEIVALARGDLVPAALGNRYRHFRRLASLGAPKTGSRNTL